MYGARGLPSCWGSGRPCVGSRLDPLAFTIPNSLLAAMGVSLASGVGATTIKTVKPGRAPTMWRPRRPEDRHATYSSSTHQRPHRQRPNYAYIRRATLHPHDWADNLPQRLAEIADLLIRGGRERTCPRAIKRARHNNYRIMKPRERGSVRHDKPASIPIHAPIPRAA